MSDFSTISLYSGCGRDSTKDFARAHPRHLLDQVEEFKVGTFEASAFSGGAPRTATGLIVFALLLTPWVISFLF